MILPANGELQRKTNLGIFLLSLKRLKICKKLHNIRCDKLNEKNSKNINQKIKKKERGENIFTANREKIEVFILKVS